MRNPSKTFKHVGWATPTIHLRGYVTTAVLLLTIVSNASAKYSGGSGTADNPYQLATAADLSALSDSPEDYDKHFILTVDSDLTTLRYLDFLSRLRDSDKNSRWSEIDRAMEQGL